jgi:formimidoylglutamate deiminase
VQGGARAAARAIGGLVAGQRADFVVLASPADAGLAAAQRLASHVFARHPGDALREVWVGGRRRVHDGVHALAEAACRRFGAARATLLQAG